MQALDISKAKKFQFEVDINGINSTDLKGLFEFIIDGVHYGFPATIKESSIKVDVPPLTEVIKKDISSGSVVECYLSVYGNGFHLEPWKGSFEVNSPIRMEAKMSFTDVDLESNNTNTTQKVVKENKVKDNIVEEEEIPYDYEKALSELAGPSPMRIGKTRKPKINKQELFKQIIKEELTFVKTGKRIKDTSTDNNIEKLIRMKVRKKLVEHLKNKKSKSNEIKDPKALMESVGMTNKNTQDRLLEAAKNKAGKDPVNIYDTIKKMIELTDKR